MTQQQLIQRLKQQPRHRNIFDDMFQQAAGLRGAFDDLKGAAHGTIETIETLTTSMLKAGSKGFTGLANGVIAANVGLAKTLAMTEALQTTFLDVAKAATFFETRHAVLNKGFGITSVNAERLSKQFIGMSAAMSGNSLESKISGEAMMKYAVSIKKMLPTFQQLGQESNEYYQGLQQSQHILQASLGLTEEQANAYTQFAGSAAANAAQQIAFTKDVAEALGDTDGSMGYMKMITEGIAEAGEAIQLQYGRLPGSLEAATIKASRLGLKLEDLAGAGESLLDIESSIGKELEYQLLTGRQLTNDQNQSLTNLYREATLRGNASDQADILAEIVEKEGATLENNLFARKQMADLLGIQEQQLASAIQKQKILEKAGEKLGITLDIDDDGAIAQAAAKLEEAGELEKGQFKALTESMDTRTTEDLLKEQLTIANEQLMLQKLAMIGSRVEGTRNNMASAAKIMAEQGQIKLPGRGAKEDYENFGATLIALGIPQKVVQEIIKSATTATTEAPGGLNATPTKDLIATPTGYGDRILLAGEDTFALSNDDTVVAGTNLFPKQSSGNSSLASKIDELIAEIRTQTRVLSKRDNTFGAGINSAYYG